MTNLPALDGARSDRLELKKGRRDGFGVLLTDIVSNSGPLSDKSSNSSNNSSISMSPPSIIRKNYHHFVSKNEINKKKAIIPDNFCPISA